MFQPSQQIYLRLIGIFALCTFVHAQTQKPDVPRPVSALVARLETNLREALKVAELLEPGRRELSALMRYYEPAAKSWQLESSLAREMGDQELFEFVVTRASSALAGGCELLSRRDLRTIDGEMIEKSRIREKYWSDTSSGKCHISADCVFLTDSDGQPTTLRNRSDLKDYWNLQKKFKVNQYQALVSRQLWETELFRSNVAYLKREHGDGLEEVPELAKALRLTPGGKVYAARLVNLTYHIQYLEGQQPKVIFLSPFAW